jgi:hypothetical protein
MLRPVLPLIGLALPCLPELVSAAEKAEPAFLNTQLVAWSPAFKPWDIGAEFRARYESKDGAGVTPNTDSSSPPSITSATRLREAIRRPHHRRRLVLHPGHADVLILQTTNRHE